MVTGRWVEGGAYTWMTAQEINKPQRGALSQSYSAVFHFSWAYKQTVLVQAGKNKPELHLRLSLLYNGLCFRHCPATWRVSNFSAITGERSPVRRRTRALALQATLGIVVLVSFPFPSRLRARASSNTTRPRMPCAPALGSPSWSGWRRSRLPPNQNKEMVPGAVSPCLTLVWLLPPPLLQLPHTALLPAPFPPLRRPFHGWETWITSSNPSWRPSASGWRICSSTRAAKSGEAPTGTSTKRGARMGKGSRDL